jgi:hypothetical protein
MMRLYRIATMLAVVGAGIALAEPPPGLPAASFERPLVGCLKAEEMPVQDLRRLGRFAALPNYFSSWRERNCWPQRLEDDRLQKTASPLGTVISIGGHDALVVALDPDWIRRCHEKPGLRPRLVRVTGNDLFAVKERIAAAPSLGSRDVLEIGFSRAEAGETNLFALYLGTRDRTARVECFDDFAELLDKSAEALAGGS